MKVLLGLSGELDEAIQELAFLGALHKDSHPANAGDVSQVLSDEAAAALAGAYAGSESKWYEIEHIERLAGLRRDGRSGYRAQGIRNAKYYDLLRPMADRTLLITRTGAQIPAIEHTMRIGQDGKLLNVLQVDAEAKRVRIVYGHQVYGSIPSIETHVHLLSNAITIAEGMDRPATVHAHPPSLVSLGRHPRIDGRFEHFNAAVYTSIEGLNRNYAGLIGVVPYRQSGTAALVDESMEPLRRHRMILWMHHGFVVREANVRRAYTLLAYAEECARAALFSLQTGARGLPESEVESFLKENGLLDAYRHLWDGLTGA